MNMGLLSAMAVVSRTTAAGALAALLLTAAMEAGADCARGELLRPDSIPRDNRDIPMPEPYHNHVASTNINRIADATLLRRFDLGRSLRLATGNAYPALNVNAMDQVPNSSWFENRNGRERMSIEEITRGPNTTGPPDTTGPWTIFRAKNLGVSPGFHIVDTHGVRYVIKIDPKEFPELSSGAEAISTRLLHASGYNVPENYIVLFDPALVRLPEEEIMIEDRWGTERPMTPEDLEAVFDRVHTFPDGRVRAVASKYIEGTALGGWRYSGTRPDDPNDFIPHEHRREIRGLRVIGSWINHYDANYGNNYDTYVTVDGRRYVRHYLIDFGGTLGASAEGPMPRTYGHRYFFDLWVVLAKIATLGLHYPLHERWDTIPHPAAGAWEARTFDPPRYKFLYPSLAFENLTDADGYWAAKIVMSFTDEQLRAVAREGRYSNPDVPEYIAKVLAQRRDKIGRYYYSRVNPLDNFRLRRLGSGDSELCFDDMAVVGGLKRPERTTYRYAVSPAGASPACTAVVRKGTCLVLPKREMPRRPCGLAVVRIQTLRAGERPSPLVCVYIRREEDGGLALAAGVRR